MLPERYRELLTAYVDGELSSRQQRTLRKSAAPLSRSAKLLKQMQADSHELRALPPARLEQDLSDSVLTLITQRQIQPPRARRHSADDHAGGGRTSGLCGRSRRYPPCRGDRFLPFFRFLL